MFAQYLPLFTRNNAKPAGPSLLKIHNSPIWKYIDDKRFERAESKF